jgi:hypothetical protein
VLIVASLLHGGARAQPPHYEHPQRAKRAAKPHAEDEPRRLDEHLFIPSLLIVDPFATTYLSATTTGTWSVSRGPGYGALGLTSTERDYPHGGLAQTFEAQIAPLSWLALRASGEGLVNSGMDSVTVLAVNPALDYAFGGGVTLSLPAAGPFRAALVFDAGRGPPRDVTLVDGLLDGLADGTLLFLDRSMLDTGRVTTLEPGVSFAFALHRALGLVGNLHYVAETGATADLGGQRDAYALGAALDFDLRAISPVPLGLAASFRLLDRWLDGVGPNREFNMGLYYVPRPSTVLGLTGGLRDYPQTREVRTTSRTALLSLRYYFGL